MYQWFLKDDVWHAFDLTAPTALCGEVSIAYGIDPIAQFVPEDGVAHGGCAAAIAEEAGDTPGEVTPGEEPKPKKRGRPRKVKA